MTLRAHAEALYEALKPLLGIHAQDMVQRTLENELRHVVPNWSDEKPRCPGWYWYKAPGITEPKLICVDHGRIDTKLMADLGAPLNLVDVQRVSGQWAGPVLPPG